MIRGILYDASFFISTEVHERERGEALWKWKDLCRGRWKDRRTTSLRFVYTSVFTVSWFAQHESERESEQVNESESPPTQGCALAIEIVCVALVDSNSERFA